MKENIRKFMAKGGFILVIATIAIVAYFLILEFANNIFKESIKEVQMVINNDGTISVPLEGDTSNLYIYWETDGGTVKPVRVPQNEEEIDMHNLDTQFSEDNKWHVAYTHSSESVVWSPQDDDGFEYESATIRATLYAATTDQIVSYIGDQTVEKIMTITLVNKDGAAEQVEDRLFTNPVRKGADSNWNQIYIVENKIEKKYTLAYRTGNQISEDGNLALCWTSDKNVLYETNLFLGGIPNFVEKKTDDKGAQSVLSSVNMVTCNIKEPTTIEAFIVDINSESYRKNDFVEEDKMCKATLKIEQ
ncbi:MAG TPA: hypothetical protein IAC41_00280 [Candidatus Merdenecus merdavium]|nr:hypothetical protein [Candidatus Merdenecus merdavium]